MTTSDETGTHRQSETTDRFGHLFHLIGDAVVEIDLTDGRPVVCEVNPAFEEVFGYARETVLGESLNEFIIPDDQQTTRAREFDRRTADGEQQSSIVRRQTTTGVREFLYRGVPFERGGRRYCFAIYADITDQRRYERHGRVLHRLLRHNLRNDLSVIMARADELATAADPEIRETAESISQHAQRIASLREEVRPLERILVGTQDVRSRDVTDLCRLAVERATSESSTTAPATTATVTLSMPAQARARAVPELQRAVQSLVENALLYAGENPTIEVRVQTLSETVEIAVVDDGPGIPDHERAPVFEDRETTDLNHASGLGLWLVRWTAEICGGDLEYERTDDGHTVVRLVLVRT